MSRPVRSCFGTNLLRTAVLDLAFEGVHFSASGETRWFRQRECSMTDSNGLVQKLWNYCNILRDDGLSYGDYIEQLTYLLFLKMADEQTQAPFNRPAIVPAEPRLADPAATSMATT